MSAAAVIVLAGLWPFGSASPATETAPTVADAAPVETAPTQPAPVADPGRAADAYEAFLASPAAADAGLRLTAMRRLADLRLEASEAAIAEGLPAGAALGEAVRLYEKLLAEPALAGATERDHWYYQLARAHAMAGRGPAAEATLRSLVMERPDSSLAPEAWFRIGEARFSARDWPAAEVAYRETRDAAPEGEFAEQAGYKLGWALFKRGQHEASFPYFAAVVDARMAAAPLAEQDAAGREIIDDSLRAMAIGFASLNGPASIEAWLDSAAVEPEWAGLAWARLGDLYREGERWTDAAAAYSAWARRASLDEEAPAMQARAIDALLEGGFSAEAIEAMADYAEAFGSQGAWWENRERENHPAVRSRLKDSLGTLASHHHAAFQAGTGPATEAARWYEQWLLEFPEAPEAPERHFLLGELWYEDGRLEAAAEAYEAAAFAYGPHPGAAEAAFAAVVARRDLVDALSTGHDAAARAGAEAGLIQAQVAFADAFGSDPRAAVMRVNAAERLLSLGRLEDALAQASHVLADGGAGASAAVALLVAGHSAFGLGEFPVAEGHYAAWLAAPGDDELVPDVEERLAASIYRQATAAETAGDVTNAVRHYRRVAATVAASPMAATGSHDAAALLFRQGEWQAAAAAYEDFLARWPEHPLAAGARISLAESLVNGGDLYRAAPALAAVAELDGEDDALRRSAAWKAAELYGQTDRPAQAASVLEDYLLRFPEPPDAAFEARARLADLAGSRGDTSRRQHWLGEIVSAHREAGQAASPRATTLAAQAAMELAMPAVERFHALELTLPLEQTVPKKVTAMETAAAALAAAAGYNVAEVTTEAAFRMGELYRAMGASLMHSARPEGLDSETLEQYELLLEEQAFPFEEQAIDIYEANAGRAAQGLYDEWVMRSFDALSSLVPARWDRRETGERVVQIHD